MWGCCMALQSSDSLRASTFSPSAPSCGTILIATMPPLHQPWYTFPNDLRRTTNTQLQQLSAGFPLLD